MAETLTSTRMSTPADRVDTARRIVNRLNGLLDTWSTWTDVERSETVDPLVMATISRLATSSASILPPDYGDDLILLALSGTEPQALTKGDTAYPTVRQVQQYVTLMLDALVTEFHLEDQSPPQHPPAAGSARRVYTATVAAKERADKRM